MLLQKELAVWGVRKKHMFPRLISGIQNVHHREILMPRKSFITTQRIYKSPGLNTCDSDTAVDQKHSTLENNLEQTKSRKSTKTYDTSRKHN